MKGEIGHGAFSTVYRGRYHGFDVAIKMLNAKTVSVLEKNVAKEATILLRLNHPNIVKFMGISIQDNQFAIVTEYLSRGSLRQLLLDTTILLEDEHKRKFALDVCKGMSYLHSEKVIHRDLKCSNLLVDKDWTVKVADFGLSREGSDIDVTMTMTACGTPAWAAPEVLKTQRYSEKADIYSFSICFWEMCTRQVPYEGIPPYQIVISVATQGRRPDLQSNDFPAPFEEIIKKCWDEEPAARPDFGELVTRFTTMVVPLPDHETPFIMKREYSAVSPNVSASYI
uniref:Protein kinase domain-containing protein n=1 Tax=Arcella intermedia TaxID=1963864 RepID=A0A6B2LB91_9EUKA